VQVSDVLDFMREFTPQTLAESWDNVGLLVGREDREATRVMTCLTLSPDVADEAIARQANLVITHHPVLFRGVQQVTEATSEGKMLLGLIENGISVFSPHTCYDSAHEGINRQLADSLELQNIRPIRPIDANETGDDCDLLGSGRFGDLATPVTFGALIDRVKSALQITDTQFVGDASQSVSRVGIACGAAAEFMSDADKLGCDVLLTGEARFHACLEARVLGVGLILPGHYATERPAMVSLAVKLKTQFSGLDVWASEVESDPVEWA
jgi:dinuclear metal center YbgI/SA1388 family protein